MHIKKRRSTLLRLCITSPLLFSSLHAADADILASISNAMTHYENVATTTKKNERYQPYIISVFEGKELEKLGVKDLEEALGLAPGVDITTDNFNNRTMIFRGSNPQAYGQTKLFIDGTLVNEVFFDSYTQYLKMPIEMIKRIEITRGPGSRTDGVNAYAGSIQVITYDEEFEGFESKDKVVLKGGSYNYKMGGFVKNYKAGDLKIFTDFYYQEDEKTVKAGPDGWSQGVLTIPGFDNTVYGRQDGDAQLWVKNWNLGLSVHYGDFYLKARNNDYTHGSAYGINWYLPDADDRQKLPSQYIEAGYETAIDDYEISLKAGLKKDSWDSKAKLGPDGWSFINYKKLKLDYNGDIVAFLADFDPATHSVTFADGSYGNHSAYQQTHYGSAFFRYKGITDHKVTIGGRYFKEETYDMTSEHSDWDTGSPTPNPAYTELFPFFNKDASRETNIFSLQDEFYVSNALSLIYGLSYEDTTYTDGITDPRVSAVYQQDAENIYKLIYSQSHRNPSWQEMYTQLNEARWGTTDIDPERVTAYEAAYVKKFSADSYLQANVFKLENKEQITNVIPTFKNVVDTDIYGIELEYKGNLTPSDQLYLNYSYVDGEDNNGTKLTNVAHHMAKAYYIYDLTESLSLSGVAKHVSAKERAEGDSRDKLDGYTKIDAALRYYDHAGDYHLTLSAKNIFDADIRYPSPPPPDTYIEDYRQEGTNFLVTFGKEF